VDKEEYAQTQATILILADLVRDLPLAEFLSAIARADSIGPIVDPTLWMRGHENMHKIEQMAAGLRKFQTAVRAVRLERG
jgi:hypothetical protein